MELMLRFCDAEVVVSAVLSGELRATAGVFLPAPVLVPALFPGHPERLPQLDTRFAQGPV